MPHFKTRPLAILAISIISLLGLATSASAAPENDNFANAQALTPGAPAVSGSTTEATGEVGEPASPSDSVWYRVNGTATGVVHFSICSSGASANARGYIGSDLGNLLRFEDSTYFYCDQVARVGVTNGSTAYLQVTDTPDFTISAEFIPSPANDSYATPTVIEGDYEQFSFDTTNATWEPTELSRLRSGNAYYDGRSLWYQWTAPASGTISLTACSRDEDNARPQVTLYNGTQLNSLNTLSQSDSGCAGGSEGGVIFWEVAAGTTYKIRVNTYYTDYQYGPGELRLQFDPLPTNDLIADAIDLGSAESVRTHGTNWTASATPEIGETPVIGENVRPASVWFKWTAPTSGQYRIDTCESHSRRADFVVGAFTSNGGNNPSPGQLQRVEGASGDDNCSVLGNHNDSGWFNLDTTAGTTYWIGIANYGGGQTGPFTLRILNSTLEPGATPTITGSPFVGQTLGLVSLAWVGVEPISLSYEWQRCEGESCTTIGGATSTSYTVTDDDIGKSLRGRVKAQNAVTTKIVATEQTAVIQLDTDGDGVGDNDDQCPSADNEAPKTNGCPKTDLTITGNPAIGGSAEVGATVNVITGAAQNINMIDPTTPAPTASVMIKSCSSATDSGSCEVRGTGTSYVLTASDIGRFIRARVAWSNTDKERVVWTDALGPVSAPVIDPVLLDLTKLKLPKKASAKKLVKNKGRFTIKAIKFACPTDGAACKINVSVTTRVKKKTRSLGSSRFTIKPGASAALTGKLSKSALKRLKASKKLKATLVVKGSGGSRGKATLKEFSITR